MSVSSHLNPEPERRLWIMYENTRRALEWTDIKLGALTIFAAFQMALIRFISPEGLASYAAIVLLAVILPIGILALSPLIEMPIRAPLLEPGADKRGSSDCMLAVGDIAKHPQMELVILLDKYLGGGITATQYHEDIVGQILTSARIATRKRRLFLAVCVLAGIAQLCLIGQLFRH